MGIDPEDHDGVRRWRITYSDERGNVGQFISDGKTVRAGIRHFLYTLPQYGGSSFHVRRLKPNEYV